ncbi:MAG: hypothetical protein MUF51_11085, partial [Vicinamibacteria bacterium]|nr:hypothetical protein [Vicinamibacteria bacterium]
MAAPIITRLFRPWPRPLARVFSVVILALWLIQMARLVQHERAQASPSLAGDLGRYGSAAQWRGVYNRGEKVGFFVSLTTPLADGYEISEDGQLQMSLLGMPVATRIQSSVRADRAFQMKSFSFALDPGSGPIRVSGALEGKRLTLSIQNSAGTRSETRELSEPPALALNLSRQLAALGIATGKRFNMQVFDPATLRNMPM